MRYAVLALALSACGCDVAGYEMQVTAMDYRPSTLDESPTRLELALIVIHEDSTIDSVRVLAVDDESDGHALVAMEPVAIWDGDHVILDLLVIPPGAPDCRDECSARESCEFDVVRGEPLPCDAFAGTIE